jgi:WD40 repeat protein
MSAESGHPDSEYKYWAFISYSHADEKWADWLHKSLETYGVPKVLVGKPSKLGPVPKRAYPVFRDRDELPSSADLGEKLTAALRGSRYLIVICSPRAVASKWVHEEIKAFKSMDREDRVLCLIVDGEPYASDHPEWGLEECFPEPIRYKVDAQCRVTGERTEPIAADARKGKDGKANAKLKLLAGMFGVNFSDLKQRDQERQHRRLQMIMMGVGVLFVVFTLLMVQLFFEKSRADAALIEARDQRDRAELEKSKAQRAERDAVLARDAAKESEQKAIEARDAATAAQELEARARAEEARQRTAAEQAQQAEAKQRAAAEKAQRDAEEARDAAKLSETKAVEAAAFAKKQQEIAEIERARAFRLLSIGDFNEATQLIESGSQATALAYLSRALGNDPKNTSAQARLLSLLEENNWALPRSAPLAHNAPVTAVAFSPDGSRLLTVAGNTAQLWNSQTAEPTGKPFTHGGLILSATFSPDGRRIATSAQDSTARVWDAATCQPVGQPFTHKDWVYSVRFSPDGRRLITGGGSRDRSMTVWDIEGGKPAVGPVAFDNNVERAFFSPDGNLALVLVENNGLLWGLTNQAQVAQLPHKGRVIEGGFSPDGRFVVTASLDGTAQVWETATGKTNFPPLTHTDQVLWAEFSPDGTRVVTASKDRTARVWDATTGQPVGQALQHGLPVNHATFSPNARWVATASEDRTARLWDSTTGQPVIEPIKMDGVARMVAFSPSGRRLAVASAANSAQLWTTLSGKPVSLPVTHDQFVVWGAFSADGRYLATTSDDRTARVWDLASGRPVGDPLRHTSRINHVAFSPDSKHVVTASEDRTARIWEVTTGKPVGEAMSHTTWVNMVDYSPDGRYLVTASEDRSARVWSATDGKPVTEPLRHDSYVKSALFSPDSKYVLTASTDKTARVWEVATGKSIHAGFKHDGEVRRAAFSRDGRFVVTASEDRTARVWEALTGKPVTEPLRHDGPVNWVDFGPADEQGNALVISASDDKTVRVWDATTGRSKAEPLRHEAVVRQAVFSPDGQLVVTVAREKAARVWETASWKPVTHPLGHEGVVRSAAFSPDGSFVVTTSEDKTAQVWMLSLPGTAPEWLGDLAETVGGFQLGEAGGAELVPEPWKRLDALREMLASSDRNDPFTRWGNWFLSDRSARTISSYSTVPVREFVNLRVETGTTNALTEVLSFQPDHGLALAKLALIVGAGSLQQADFYSRLAATYEPTNPPVLWRRALVLQKRQLPEEAWKIMENALRLDPRNFSGFGPGGREIKVENRAGAVSTGWLPEGWEDYNAEQAASVTYEKLSDPPPGAPVAIRVGVKSPTRLQAQVRGPRVVARAGRKIVVEGFARSSQGSEFQAVAREFVEPFEEHAKGFTRASAEWKAFKIELPVRKDVAADILLQVATDARVDLAGVRVTVQ